MNIFNGYNLIHFKHDQATRILCHLLTIHDLDFRLQSPLIRQNVSQLYIPFLDLVISISKRFYFDSAERRRRRPLSNKGNDDDDDDDNDEERGASSIRGSEFNDVQPRYDAETTRHILICFIYVLKNLSEEAFRLWMGKNSFPRLKKFCRLLKICVTTFGYRGKNFYKNTKEQQRKAEEAKRGIEESIRKQKHRLSGRRGKAPNIEISGALGADSVVGAGGGGGGGAEDALASTLTSDFKEQLGKDLLKGQLAKMAVREEHVEDEALG